MCSWESLSSSTPLEQPVISRSGTWVMANDLEEFFVDDLVVSWFLLDLN